MDTTKPSDVIAETEDLRDVIGTPSKLVADKEMPALDVYCRRFIEMSPFLVMASTGDSGHLDVSPRGDPPGFVKVADANTLYVPDRPGNRRVDTMRNILANEKVGLIFFLPGYEETVRVRGRASIVRDADLLETMAVGGKSPNLAIRVIVDEVFFHCAKAIKRSGLWGPDAQIEPGIDFPRFGKILAEQRKSGKSEAEMQAFLDDNYKNQLY